MDNFKLQFCIILFLVYSFIQRGKAQSIYENGNITNSYVEKIVKKLNDCIQKEESLKKNVLRLENEKRLGVWANTTNQLSIDQVQIDILKKQIEECSKDKNQLYKTVDLLQEDISDCKTRLHTCEDELSKCKIRIQELENEKEELIKTIIQLRENIFLLEKTVNHLRDSINRLQLEFNQLKKDKEFLQKRLNIVSLRVWAKYDVGGRNADLWIELNKEKIFRDGPKDFILKAGRIREIVIYAEFILREENEISGVAEIINKKKRSNEDGYNKFEINWIAKIDEEKILTTDNYKYFVLRGSWIPPRKRLFRKFNGLKEGRHELELKIASHDGITPIFPKVDFYLR